MQFLQSICAFVLLLEVCT